MPSASAKDWSASPFSREDLCARMLPRLLQILVHARELYTPGDPPLEGVPSLTAGPFRLHRRRIETAPFITVSLIPMTLNESPVYMEAKAQRKVEKAPIIEVWRSGKRPLFTVFGMAFGTMANGYVFLTFMAAYLINYQGISAAVVANIVVAGAVATSISPYVFGWLTDHFGRRRVNLVLASILVVYPPFAFMLASSGDLTLVYIGVVGGFALVVTGMNGSYGAYFPELFGSGFRVTGVTLGRELASMIAGGFTPLIATALIAASGGSWIPIAVLMCATAIVTLVSTALAPETRGRDLVTDEDAFAERQRTR